MRILHIIYTTGIAGAEKYLLYLLPELKKYNVDCELICICPNQNMVALQKYCAEMNAKDIKASLFTITSKLSYLNTARKIYKYLKARKIHIIHSHLFSSDFIAVLIKKLFFKKLIILSTKHGYEEEYLLQIGLGNKKIRYNTYYYISRWVINNIDHNLAVSQAISDVYSYVKLGKEKMKFVHHGISMLSPIEEETILPGDPKILMIGRMAQIKGHVYLIEALPKVIGEFPNLKLILAGDGPLKEELIQKARALNVFEHIDFAGFASPKDYAAQCQIMILPSLFESFGLVYIESFALKIPVIAFDAEAANQIIENNETGILVPKKDSKALADKIIYLLESPAERNRITENAYRKYVEYYNAERMARETAEWYHSVLD
ncbi:MAG: glycosyltransferase family 4 protein [Bacteroidota bacterium]|nr:glycosyltransferase family 4 protein [Bacteroidota bacterium]